MKSIKDFLNFFREQSKQRALVILLLYMLFFIVVFIVFSPKNYKPIETIIEDVDPLSNYEETKVYSFEYLIDCLELDTWELKGTNYGTKINVYINEEQYLLEDNVLYKIENLEKAMVENELIFCVLSYSPNYISKLIKEAVLVSKTENFSETTILKEYQFADNIIISTIEDDKEIKEVNLEFLNDDVFKNLKLIIY